jgi:hypothetical protein
MITTFSGMRCLLRGFERDFPVRGFERDFPVRGFERDFPIELCSRSQGVILET